MSLYDFRRYDMRSNALLKFNEGFLAIRLNAIAQAVLIVISPHNNILIMNYCDLRDKDI